VKRRAFAALDLEPWEAIEVIWVDSEREDGWVLTREASPQKSLGCRTVGMFYRITDEDLSVVLSTGDIGERDEQYCGSITIPRVAISTVRKLQGRMP
jgi:hypothetical protein